MFCDTLDISYTSRQHRAFNDYEVKMLCMVLCDSESIALKPDYTKLKIGPFLTCYQFCSAIMPIVLQGLYCNNTK